MTYWIALTGNRIRCWSTTKTVVDMFAIDTQINIAINTQSLIYEDGVLSVDPNYIIIPVENNDLISVVVPDSVAQMLTIGSHAELLQINAAETVDNKILSMQFIT